MSLKNRNIRGMTIVEAAIVMPLLLALTLGLVEYGHLLLRMQQIENVARQAARLAATPDVTPQEVTSAVDSMMADYGLSKTDYKTLSKVPDTSGMAKRTQFSVTISFSYKDIALTGNAIKGVNGGSPMVPCPSVIGRTVWMAKEGP